MYAREEGGDICHILGQVMQPAISVNYIKMKSFNTNKITTESQVQKQSLKWCNGKRV